MNLYDIPDISAFSWDWNMVDKNVIATNKFNERFLLNNTSSIIWEKINGVYTIQDIINDLFEQYGKENPIDYLTELVNEAIKEFEKNGLVILKQMNELESWLKYE